MSHWGQEKKFRDVRKTMIIIISRKYSKRKMKNEMQENLQPVVLRTGFEPAHLCSTLACAKHCATEAAVKQSFQNVNSA